MTAASDPSSTFEAITPSDSTDLTGIRALYVGGAGNVDVRGVGSSTTVAFDGVTAGTILPISVSRVMASTTATLIVGLR